MHKHEPQTKKEANNKTKLATEPKGDHDHVTTKVATGLLGFGVPCMQTPKAPNKHRYAPALGSDMGAR